ncbi:SDR family oxidoreductase [Bacillus mobilis]|uniref:SDR family oxidoreductase n=1 Tax=Bacillus mobilis TaxID=2026190 RepID=UPI00399D03FB
MKGIIHWKISHIGKFVEISDVTNVILFLMSDKSDAIRGQNIVVDYGYTIV